MSLHSKKYHKEHPGFAASNIAISQDKCREWHRSEEGIRWHKEHAEVFTNRNKATIICIYCGKEAKYDEFCSKRWDGHVFCSNNCKSAYRRRSGVDNITVYCPDCKEPKIQNKYAKVCRCKPCQYKARHKIN
jgi:hypothetical protein